MNAREKIYPEVKLHKTHSDTQSDGKNDECLTKHLPSSHTSPDTPLHTVVLEIINAWEKIYPEVSLHLTHRDTHWC